MLGLKARSKDITFNRSFNLNANEYISHITEILKRGLFVGCIASTIISFACMLIYL